MSLARFRSARPVASDPVSKHFIVGQPAFLSHPRRRVDCPGPFAETSIVSDTPVFVSLSARGVIQDPVNAESSIAVSSTQASGLSRSICWNIYGLSHSCIRLSFCARRNPGSSQCRNIYRSYIYAGDLIVQVHLLKHLSSQPLLYCLSFCTRRYPGSNQCRNVYRSHIKNSRSLGLCIWCEYTVRAPKLVSFKGVPSLFPRFLRGYFQPLFINLEGITACSKVLNFHKTWV